MVPVALAPSGGILQGAGGSFLMQTAARVQESFREQRVVFKTQIEPSFESLGGAGGAAEGPRAGKGRFFNSKSGKASSPCR